MQTGHDRPDRDVEDLRRVGVGEVADVDVHDHVAEVVGHGGERADVVLETVLAREDHAKEVKLFDLGELFLGRYQDIFRRLYTADRDLTVRRDSWGFAMGLIGTASSSRAPLL